MNALDITPQKYGLYYPYFHVRDERWLKLSALYWPRIVRIVPEDYPTRDSETVRVLQSEADFIRNRPPGRSVDVASAVFLEAVHDNVAGLHARYGIDAEAARTLESPRRRPDISAVHTSQIRPDLAQALVEAGLAVNERIDLSDEVDRSWLVMHEALVAVYTSVLAEDFAEANKLIPTTDQPAAYAVANDWAPGRIASVLLDDGTGPANSAHESSAVHEALAFLALDLVVPADLDMVPAGRIVAVRRDFGAEFLAFRTLVDQTAVELSNLHGVRDSGVLRGYLQDVVVERFEAPLAELRHALASSRLGVATMAINVKTQLPASMMVAGGAWLAGHPAVAGSAVASIGLLAVGHDARRQRKSIQATNPAVSYLMHTQETMRNQTLLRRTMRRVQRIGGV